MVRAGNKAASLINGSKRVDFPVDGPVVPGKNILAHAANAAQRPAILAAYRLHKKPERNHRENFACKTGRKLTRVNYIPAMTRQNVLKYPQARGLFVLCLYFVVPLQSIVLRIRSSYQHSHMQGSAY
jgi:hypothetical protein